VREIGVHYYYEVAGAEFETMDVGCAETELACASLEENVWGVGFCELVGNDLRPVGRAVVDYYELPVEFSGGLDISIAAQKDCGVIWEVEWIVAKGRRTAR
jgi:hypothetical protein